MYINILKPKKVTGLGWTATIHLPHFAYRSIPRKMNYRKLWIECNSCINIGYRIGYFQLEFKVLGFGFDIVRYKMPFDRNFGVNK